MLNWDIRDGHVVCRTLGYQAGAVTVVYRCNDVFGFSKLITWLNNMRCQGNESSLKECDFYLETYGWTYGYDAGVVCNTGNKTGLYPTYQKDTYY